MPVEVILKTKIEGLGSEADIVSVKPGYARNFLIPKDFAAPATSATKRQMEELKRKRAEREAAELNDAQELAGKLGKLKLVFVLESGEGQEKSFGAVTNLDIATKLKEAGYEVDRKKIDLPKPIKDSGRARSHAEARLRYPGDAPCHGQPSDSEGFRRDHGSQRSQGWKEAVQR